MYCTASLSVLWIVCSVLSREINCSLDSAEFLWMYRYITLMLDSVLRHLHYSIQSSVTAKSDFSMWVSLIEKMGLLYAYRKPNTCTLCLCWCQSLAVEANLSWPQTDLLAPSSLCFLWTSLANRKGWHILVPQSSSENSYCTPRRGRKADQQRRTVKCCQFVVVYAPARTDMPLRHLCLRSAVVQNTNYKTRPLRWELVIPQS